MLREKRFRANLRKPLLLLVVLKMWMMKNSIQSTMPRERTSKYLRILSMKARRNSRVLKPLLTIYPLNHRFFLHNLTSANSFLKNKS